MARDARDLASALADQAEAVCRHYLSNGSRHGNYWQVGDVRNTPGTARATFDLVNARVSLESDNWEFSVYSRNLLDKKYNVDAVPLPIDAFNLDFNFVTRGTPRTVGIEATYHM